MQINCPECGLLFSHIQEDFSARFLVHKDVKCKCGAVYHIGYPKGSRHQFNREALADCINLKQVKLLPS